MRFQVIRYNAYLMRFALQLLTATTSSMSRAITLPLKASFKPLDPPKQSLILTQNEDQLFTLIDDFCKRLFALRAIRVEARVAGGWVRDKLIGTQSDDIDVALSSISGVSFAQDFISYIRSRGIDAKNPHTIRQNPDQSKHLETATADILGAKIDFVNLRSEEYSAASRIPSSVKFGTPLEDALRRDINFNAMFYNIHTREIEDPLGTGLSDLRAGVVRTPLEPLDTFRDDPLRILRCFRFASRLGMKVNNDIISAARVPEIQMALTQKVARERVGIEISKMLVGRDPMFSIMLLAKSSLIKPILTPPGRLPYSPPENVNPSISASLILNSILRSQNDIFSSINKNLVRYVLSSKDIQGRLFLACLLTPWKDINYKQKSRILPAAEYVVGNALKLGRNNHYLDGVPRMIEALPKLRELFIEDSARKPERVRIGLILQDRTVHDRNAGLEWRSSLIFSLVQELASLWVDDSEGLPVAAARQTIEEYNCIAERIQELDLTPSLDQKYLMTGDEIFEMFNLKSGGPWLKTVFNRINEWQLEHPGGTKEELMSWVKAGVLRNEFELPAEVERECKRARLNAPQSQIDTCQVKRG